MYEAEDPTEEQREAEHERRTKLEAAIREYYGDSYLMNWVLVVETTNMDLQRESKTAMGYVQGWDQSFVSTRGLLDMANHVDRSRN